MFMKESIKRVHLLVFHRREKTLKNGNIGSKVLLMSSSRANYDFSDFAINQPTS